MARTPAAEPSFEQLYRPLARATFDEIASAEVGRGADPEERARAYAARGKPEFALAFLLLCALDDAEKRGIYAAAHEQRAANTERKARSSTTSFTDRSRCWQPTPRAIARLPVRFARAGPSSVAPANTCRWPRARRA